MNTTTLRSALKARPSWMQWAGIGSCDSDPIWVQAIWTVAFAGIIALGFTVLGFVFGAHSTAEWLDLRQWGVLYMHSLIVSLTVGFLIQLMFALGVKLLGPRRLRALAGWRRTAYYTGIPVLGSIIGWPIGVSLLVGNLNVLRRMSSSDFLASVMFSVLLSALFFLYFSQRAKRARAELRANEAQLRLLQGQMEPHFLFNTLANVISLVDADAPRAKQMLEALTDYLRASLGGLRHGDSTLATELELARRYLALMRTRMGERLRFEIDVDEALGRAVLMPLVLQPLIENAVKHGLEPQVDGGTVRVHAVRGRVEGQDVLQVCVEDDGAGLAAAARRPRRLVAGGADGNGIALGNLRERLQARFGAGASLTLAELDGGGTRACLVLPWQAVSAA